MAAVKLTPLFPFKAPERFAKSKGVVLSKPGVDFFAKEFAFDEVSNGIRPEINREQEFSFPDRSRSL